MISPSETWNYTTDIIALLNAKRMAIIVVCFAVVFIGLRIPGQFKIYCRKNNKAHDNILY